MPQTRSTRAARTLTHTNGHLYAEGGFYATVPPLLPQQNDVEEQEQQQHPITIPHTGIDRAKENAGKHL